MHPNALRIAAAFGLITTGGCASDVDELGMGAPGKVRVETSQSITVGWSWGCSLYSDSRVACWGYVMGEEVGTPTFIPQLAGSLMIASSYPRVCGLKPDGELVCIRAGAPVDIEVGPTSQQIDIDVASLTLSQSGELVILGTSGEVQSEGWMADGTWRELRPVQGLPKVRSLGSGGKCAIAEDGSLWCWPRGRDDFTATQVTVSGEIQSFVQFNDVVVVLLTSGEVWTLPINDQAADSTTRLLHTLPGATSLNASVTRTCAIGPAGVSCWSLAYGPARRIEHGMPELISGTADAVEVGVGLNHGCVRSAVGAVKCWGFNGQGQLGQGTTGNKPIDKAIAVLSGATEVAVTSGTTCASTPEGMYCWGRNSEGQAGLPSGEVGSPALVPDTVDLVQLDLAFDTGCGLRNSTVLCWGDNQVGAVGVAGAGVVARPTPVPGMTGIDSVYVGGQRACALRAGALWCWGRDADSHFLRRGGSEEAREPIQLPVPGLVVDVYLSPRHTCVVDEEAKLLCWGGNRSQQITLENTNTVEVPQVVATNVEQVALERSLTCFRSAGEPFRCIGAGAERQAEMLNQVAPVTGIALQANQPCATKSDGTVWCWAYQEGAAELELENVVAFSKYSHSCWIDRQSNVSCAGESYHGQLGDGEHRSDEALLVKNPVEP